MTFLAFRPFRRRKHRNDVIVTSYIKISQILKLKSKDITSKTLHAEFYASRIKNNRIRRGVKYASPRVWSVFKSPGKIGLRHILQVKHILGCCHGNKITEGASQGLAPKKSEKSVICEDIELKFGIETKIGPLSSKLT